MAEPSKFLKHNHVHLIDVFNDKIKQNQNSQKISDVLFTFKAAEVNVFISFYKEDILFLCNDEKSSIKIYPHKNYLVRGYSKRVKMKNKMMTGVELIKYMLDLEEENYKVIFGKKYSDMWRKETKDEQPN